MSHGNTLSNKTVNDLGKRLLEAARHGNTEEVNNLMSSGAPLTTDWLGTTPLHLAAIYGHTSTAEALIKSGISRDGRTKVDKAPLHFACQHGHLDIVKLLVTGGAHINAADMLKMTPLHWAVEANNFDICLLLLNAGVQTGIKNKFDKTPLRIARDKGYQSIAKLLCDEKFQMLQDIDVVHHNKLYDKNLNSVKICRTDNIGLVNNSGIKKPKTKRFPMVAGTWTGGEAQNQERIDMIEQKKLGTFKKRPPPQVSPFLGSLHMSSSPLTPMKEYGTEQERRSSNIVTHGSPLHQLVETIRQSTYVGDGDVTTSKTKQKSDIPLSSSSSSTIPTVSSSQSKVDTKVCGDIFDSNALYSDIPVISTLTLNSLPANIHAIPLRITADDLMKEKMLNTCNPHRQELPAVSTSQYSKSLTSSSTTTLTTTTITSLSSNLTVTNSQTTTRLSNPPNKPDAKSQTEKIATHTASSSASTPLAVPEANHQHKNIPVSLPVDLLNQIANGDITLHNLLIENSNLKDANKFMGIKTEMGTIPIIPVSGEGGLQLIPVENNVSSLSSSNTTDKKVENHTVAKIQAPRPPAYPLSSYPPFHHQGMVAQYQQPITATSSITSTGNPRPGVPTPMLVPTGIYLPPGHPGFLQIHRPQAGALYSPVSTPQNLVMPSFYPSYGPGHHPSPPAVIPPVLHPGSHQILVHPSVQPTFLTPHVQPHYVYLDGSSATVNQKPPGVSAVIRNPGSPQQPFSTT